MTALDKVLKREVEVRGETIVVEIHPAKDGIGAHVSFKMRGAHKPYRSIYIEPEPVKATK